MSKGSLAKNSYLFLYFNLEEECWKGTKRTVERKSWRQLECNSPEHFKRDRIRQHTSNWGLLQFQSLPFWELTPLSFFSFHLCSFPPSDSLNLSSPTCLVVKKKTKSSRSDLHLNSVHHCCTSLLWNLLPSRGRFYLNFKAIYYSQDSKVTHSQKMVGNPLTY